MNAWYSLGIHVTDSTIQDVLIGSPAYNAGLGPEMKIVAVNGRRMSEDLLRAAIRDSKTSSVPIEMIVENAGFFKVVKIDYDGGEKYPHLVRTGTGASAVLDNILKPMTNHPHSRSAE